MDKQIDMLNKPLSPAHLVPSDEQDFISGNRTNRLVLLLLTVMLLGCSFSSILGFGNDQATDSVVEDSPTVAVSPTQTSASSTAWKHRLPCHRGTAGR